MYALVIDGAVQSVGRLPNSARRLDNQAWVMGLATAPTELVEACGYFPVTNNPPTYDPATEVLERGDVTVVAGVPTVEYTVRDKTQAELDAEADETDRQAKGVNLANAVTTLRNWADQMEGVTVTTGNAVNVLQQFVDRQAVFYDRFADLLEYQRIDALGKGEAVTVVGEGGRWRVLAR